MIWYIITYHEVTNENEGRILCIIYFTYNNNKYIIDSHIVSIDPTIAEKLYSVHSFAV